MYYIIIILIIFFLIYNSYNSQENFTINPFINSITINNVN